MAGPQVPTHFTHNNELLNSSSSPWSTSPLEIRREHNLVEIRFLPLIAILGIFLVRDLSKNEKEKLVRPIN